MPKLMKKIILGIEISNNQWESSTCNDEPKGHEVPTIGTHVFNDAPKGHEAPTIGTHAFNAAPKGHEAPTIGTHAFRQ
jgi:hypothetical protein